MKGTTLLRARRALYILLSLLLSSWGFSGSLLAECYAPPDTLDCTQRRDCEAELAQDTRDCTICLIRLGGCLAKAKDPVCEAQKEARLAANTTQKAACEAQKARQKADCEAAKAALRAVAAKCEADPSQPPPSGSRWSLNGSLVSLRSEGAARSFYLEDPRRGLVDNGINDAEKGALVFSGKKQGDVIAGTAYVFSGRCGKASYEVSGPVSADNLTITVFGKAPVFDESCKVASHRDNALVFSFLGPDPQPRPSP